MRGAFFEILDFGGFQNDRELIKAFQGIPPGRVGHRSPGIPRLPQRGANPCQAKTNTKKDLTRANQLGGKRYVCASLPGVKHRLWAKCDITRHKLVNVLRCSIAPPRICAVVFTIRCFECNRRFV